MADDNPERDNGSVGDESRVEPTEVGSAEHVAVGTSSATGVAKVARGENETTTITEGADSRIARRQPAKPRRRWPWAVALVLVTGLLAASATMTYEMIQRADEWSAQVDDITATSYDLGQQIADGTAENVKLAAEIDLLEEQLSNSKDTVLKLSDEKAQWRDDTEFAQQQVDATAELLNSAASVANGLQRCSEGQFELIVTITGTEEFDPEAIASYQDSVTELCDKAQSANASLQRALTE